MRLTSLAHTVLEVNALIDTGKHNDISLAEVKKHIEAGDIFRFIAETGKEDIDLSLIKGDIEAEITAGLQDILLAHSGNERRKWGVGNNGLCLVVAWVTEMIQQRRWAD